MEYFVFLLKYAIQFMENTQTNLPYSSPTCEVFELAQEGVMAQTSYHYQPGWDD